ncbi:MULTISPECIES: hypothetical protein [unclassified Streptomyces]|uniref:hypothetical protein n=1 Tax=unclassified Streptomyces TaxID=2593676 RepID=UPI001C9CD0E6|nr:hypothetical protein [Streptomyces sp. me109]
MRALLPLQAEQAALFESVRAGAQSVEPATAVRQSSLMSIRFREKGVSMAGRKGRAVASLVAVLIVGGILSGCSKEYNDKRGKGDAPVQGRMGDNTAAEVFNMPDGFGNLATKCVGHGFRAYVTTNASGPSNVEIVPDKTCAS